jgi:hypothetical protein
MCWVDELYTPDLLAGVKGFGILECGLAEWFDTADWAMFGKNHCGRALANRLYSRRKDLY